MELGERPEWHHRAACRDAPVDVFFPEEQTGRPAADSAVIVASVLYCSRCPVAEDCLDHAVHHEAEGIWAGMSGRQIRRIRTARGIRLNNLSIPDECPLGHPYTDDNVFTDSAGFRRCRTCHRLDVADRRDTDSDVTPDAHHEGDTAA